MITTTDTDRELLRLHRRSCTDLAARMRLPAWEHLPMPLAEPLAPLTVSDLLQQIVAGNLKAAAALSGQPEPAIPELGSPDDAGFGSPGFKIGSSASGPVEVVVESIRTLLAVASGLAVTTEPGEPGLSPNARGLLWQRTAELTVLGYDLQQAIKAGTGLDELLVDCLISAEVELNVWPHLDPLPTDIGTPPLQRLLALTGRPPGLWVDPTDPNCSTGQC